MKYRKKPVVIETYQTEKEVVIHTLEGDMKANIGDYIITGANGEQYPCKPDIFHKTYEPVSNAEFDHSYTEIIKALECWIKNFDGKATDLMTLCGAQLLINRLKEENGELTVKLEKWLDRYNKQHIEIVKLKHDVQAAKSEARKEFAERLKALLPYDGMSPKGRFKFGRINSLDINNLLKEMW